MSTEALLPDFPLLSYAECYTGLTVRGGHTITRATAANICALGRPAKRIGTVMPSTGATWRLSYVRSHAGIEQLRVAWAYRSDPDVVAAASTVQLSLKLRDATGNTINASDTRVPRGFDNSTIATIPGSLTTLENVHVASVGYLDIDACATTLTDSSWELEFTFARSGGDVTLEWIEAWECPRSVVDDASTYGALTGPLNPGNQIVAGSTTTKAYERIAKTIAGGVASNRSYLNVAWPADITATVPKTTSATFTAFTNMLESGTTPWSWFFRPRVVYLPNDGDGEPARVRFLYYVSGGGNAVIRTDTGSSSGPFDTGTLTGASWQWSSWVKCEVPTNGTDGIAQVQFTGKTDAGTLYVAGIALEENQ